MSQQKYNDLFEGLERHDLARLVHPKLHVDEFKSKMGDDANIIVLSFKVKEKNPANDLMNFIERGYEWVLDADVSTGELEDGDYLVFVEMERNTLAAKQIVRLIDDILNLTDQKLSDWNLQYQKNKEELPISVENIRSLIPLSPDEYINRFGQTDSDKDLDQLKENARIKFNKKAAVNDLTEMLRVAAGIK